MPHDSFVFCLGIFLLPNWTSNFPINSTRQSFRSVAEVSFRETTRRLRLDTCLYSHHECQHFLCHNVVDHWCSFIKENQISALWLASAWSNHIHGCNSLRSRSLCFKTRKTGDIFNEVHSARISNFRKHLRQRNQRFYPHSFADKTECLSRLRTELPSKGWRPSRVGVLFENSYILHAAWRVRVGGFYEGPKWQFGGLWKDWFRTGLTRDVLEWGIVQDPPETFLKSSPAISISFCSGLELSRFSHEALFCGTCIKIEQ